MKTFAVVINGSQRRFDESYFKFFEAFEFSFGTGFWSNVAIVFTMGFNSKEDLTRRADEEPPVSKESMTALIRGELTKKFPKCNSQGIPVFFTDVSRPSFENRPFENFDEFRKLVKISKANVDFNCENIEKAQMSSGGD